MKQNNIFFNHLDIKLMVEETLDYLQVPIHLKGYKYLTEAIVYTIKNYNEKTTKNIISSLAINLNKNSNEIYRNINTVIKKSWNNIDKFNSVNIFNLDSNISPTPNEYIKNISEYLISKMLEANIEYNKLNNNMIEKIDYNKLDYSIDNLLSTLNINFNNYEYDLIRNCIHINLLVEKNKNIFSTLFKTDKEYNENIQVLKEIINRSWPKISLQEKVLIFHSNDNRIPIPIEYINSITNYIKKCITVNNIDIINSYITKNLKNNCIKSIKQNNITNFETKYDKLYEVIDKMDINKLTIIQRLIKTNRGKLYLEKYFDDLIIKPTNITLLQHISYFDKFSYYDGYKYFNDALDLIENDESALECIIKEIYIPIALKYNKNYKVVERSIRTFKINSFNNMPKNLKSDIFYKNINKIPPNKAYLYYIHKYIYNNKTKQKTL